MRKPTACVPMITLCLLLCACGGGEKQTAQAARAPYQEMESAQMTAEVTAFYGDEVSAFTLRCDYAPETSTVEVLAPETAAGVKARMDGDGLTLLYEDDCLPAGPLSGEELSPASCLPRLMSALRGGWLLEENEEDWGEDACLRLALEQTGAEGGKIVSTLWLRAEDHVPVRGEIAVDEKIILQAEFTDFQFGAILEGNGGAGE